MNARAQFPRILGTAFVLWFFGAVTRPASADQANHTPAVARWDAAAVGGILISHPPDAEGTRNADDWNPAGVGGFTVGRYLTTHLKAEAEFLFSSDARRYVTRYINVPGIGNAYPVGSEEFRRLQGVGATVGWQFFENQWTHPMVFGGVEVDSDLTRERTWQQVWYSGDPRLPSTTQTIVARERMEGPNRTFKLRGVAGIAAKLYVTPHTFFRTDARMAIGGQATGHLAFRAGFGVDW
ncbi:MAG TPA: hypothetical protein VEK56_12335 [Vicinamibacterales bacterium]|nr:hypothetical protein [Vicinamibacterales bacterium]